MANLIRNILDGLKKRPGESDLQMACDVHQALQEISGMKPSGSCPFYVQSSTDVNGDTRIGIEKVAFRLEQASGFR